MSRPAGSGAPTQEYVSVQGLRGIAVLVVAAVHLAYVEVKYGHGGTWLVAMNVEGFGHLSVDLFFVISGFIITTTTFGKFGSGRQVASFAYRRFVRIYPIYWLYFLLVLPVYLARPEVVNASQGGQVNLLASFLLLPDVRLGLIPIAWTLSHEVYYYSVFCLLLFLPERRLPAALMVWTGVTVLLAALRLVYPPTNPYFNLLSNPINVEFIMGAAVALRLRQRPARHPWLLVGIGIAAIFAGYAIYLLYTGTNIIDRFSRVVLSGVPCALIVYGMTSLERSRPREKAPLAALKWMGDASYSIYLCHVLVLSVLGRIWQALAIPGPAANALFLLAVAAAAVAAGVVSYRVLEVPFLRWARKFDPARKAIRSVPLESGRPAG